MQRSSVVLPQPDGPTTHMISFFAIANDSWRNATTAPSRNSFDAFSATIMGAAGVIALLRIVSSSPGRMP